MDEFRVIVENWPAKHSLVESAPIIIALVALLVSLYSVYLTRRSFVMAHRPYVWGMSYGVIDTNQRALIPVPSKVGYRVLNAPARIRASSVTITLAGETLFTHTEKSFVRFPNANSEWTFSVGKDDFQNILDRAAGDKAQLSRVVSIEYSALSGGPVYHYMLKQSYVSADNQWQDTDSTAN